MARQHTNLKEIIFLYLFLFLLYALTLLAEFVVSGLVLLAIRTFYLLVTGSASFIITARAGSSEPRSVPPVILWLLFGWGLRSTIFEPIFHSFDIQGDTAYLVASIVGAVVSGLFFVLVYVQGSRKQEKR